MTMSWRNIFLSSALSFLGVVLFGASAFGVSSSTVDQIQFLVLDHEGEPIYGVPVELYDSSLNYIEYGSSNESGYVNYFWNTGEGLEEGTYKLFVKPGDAWECDSCSVYESEYIYFDLDLDDAVDDGFGGNMIVLDDVDMQLAPTIVSVTVEDQNGDPAEDVWVSGWAESLDSSAASGDSTSVEWFNVQTDESGIALAAVSPGVWSVSTWSEEYSDTYVDGVTIEEGENDIEMTVQSYDATINVAVVNSDGGAFVLGDSQYGSVSCYNDDWSVYAWGDVNPGESTAELAAVGGETYTCSLWLEGSGSTEGTVELPEDGEGTVTIEILSYTAPVEIQLVDGDTEDLLTDVSNFDYYAYSVLDENGDEYWNDYHWGFGSNGESGEFNVLDGVTYEAGVFVSNDSFEDGGEFEEASFSTMGLHATSEGAQYIQNYDMQEFVGDEAATTTLEFPLEQADATIEVTVEGTDGAWVHAEEIVEDGWGAFVGDDTGNDNVASLAVKSGVTYEVFAYPYDAWDGEKMPPKTVEVTPEEGETVEVTMVTQEVDHTINITIEIDQADAQAFGIQSDFGDFVWCYAFNEDGTENMVDIFGSEGTLGWLSNSEAYIGCMGYSGDTFLRTQSETLVQTGEEDGETDVSLTLGEFGEWYEEQSYTFDGTVTNEIELPDGSIMTIPAVVESGNVTLTVGTASNMTANDENYSVEGWNYELRDSNGDLIENFDTNITIRMKYDEELLEELGVDEDTLSVKSQGDNNEWTNAASFELDTEEDTVTASVSHFSTYAIVGDLGLDNPSTKEELEGVASIERLEDQTVTITYDSGDTRTFRVFDNGTAKAKAQLHTNGDVLIAINKRFMRTFDVYSGEQLDQVKLFKNKQAYTKFKRMNVYKKKAGQNNVMVLARTKKNQKKKYKLRSYVVKNGGNIVRRNVQAITLDEPVAKFKNIGIKKNKRNGMNARVLVTKKGKKIDGLKYKVTKKKGRLVTVQ